VLIADEAAEAIRKTLNDEQKEISVVPEPPSNCLIVSTNDNRNLESIKRLLQELGETADALPAASQPTPTRRALGDLGMRSKS